MASIAQADQLDLELFVIEGLGDASYLLASGDEAVVVDPQRDVEPYVRAAAARGVTIRAALETHVHNDYVSGALELRDRAGAEIAAPARGNYAFPHRGLAEGDELAAGDLLLAAIETPGHTPEHLSYLVQAPGADGPIAVFTGGSLLVGSAGRSDLLGDELTDELARAQFRTMRRLADLPDEVRVLPTHGGGSFCAATRPGGDRTSTMGAERAGNPALRAETEREFLESQLSGLLAYPAYYRHMAPINRAGPRLVDQVPRPPAIPAEALAALLDRDVWLVDGRDRVAFAAGHVPGAVNIELNQAFASYVGWLIPFGQPVALVLPDGSGALGEAVTQLLRVGYEDLRGHLDGGMEAWRASGRPERSYPITTVEELCEATRSRAPIRVLDVRQDRERARGVIPGSLEVFVGDLPARVRELPGDREVWAICASGHRSAMAASLLDREEIPVRLVTPGGVRDWLKRCG